MNNEYQVKVSMLIDIDAKNEEDAEHKALEYLSVIKDNNEIYDLDSTTIFEYKMREKK